MGHPWTVLDSPGYLRTLGHGTSVDVHYVGHPWTVLGCPGYLRTLGHGTGIEVHIPGLLETIQCPDIVQNICMENDKPQSTQKQDN